MDFSLTEDQLMLKAMVRDFATKELEPIAAEIDRDARFPAESIKKMAELGLMGICFPEKYGGGGLGSFEFALIVEELSRVCAATAMVFFVSTGLTGKPLYLFGNEEQRRKFVGPIARGEKLACFALTEAGAGSDAAALVTTATPKPGGYVINGNKIFISNGKEADIVVVFATLDKSLKHKGITSFIVEKGTPGLSVGKLENKMGIRGSSAAELIFENCFVPEENILGQKGEGFKIAMASIDEGRINVAAQAVGIAQGAFDKALEYARERQQFGQPIINFQAIQWMLSDMATQIDSARLLIYRATYLQDNGLPFVKESSMAKLSAAETAMSVTNKALQIYGGYGYVKDYPLERYFRDARITALYEGTSEIQHLTIARQLMKSHD